MRIVEVPAPAGRVGREKLQGQGFLALNRLLGPRNPYLQVEPEKGTERVAAFVGGKPAGTEFGKGRLYGQADECLAPVADFLSLGGKKGGHLTVRASGGEKASTY